jgi:hypothetical protein
VVAIHTYTCRVGAHDVANIANVAPMSDVIDGSGGGLGGGESQLVYRLLVRSHYRARHRQRRRRVVFFVSQCVALGHQRRIHCAQRL